MSHRSRLRMMFSRNDWPMRRVASKAEPQLDLYMDELIASVTIGGVSRDNLDENGGGNQSLKRQPVAEL
jgi:hypothetical protein